MALKDKTSIFKSNSPQSSKQGSAFSNLVSQATVVKNTSQTGRVPNSALLPQAKTVKSNFIEGNPTSNKINQAGRIQSKSPIGNPTTSKTSQGITVLSNSPVGNPSTSKVGQTNNAFFNVGKANQFSNGGKFVQSFSGKTVSSGATVTPTFTFMELFFQRVGNAGGTSENQTPMTAFYNNINTIEI